MRKVFKVTEQNLLTIVVLRIEGEMDMYSYQRFEDALLHAEYRSRKLVLNLQEVSYVGSATLGALIGWATRFREAGGDLCLCCVDARIKKIIELLGFTKHLQVFDAEAAAVSYLQQLSPAASAAN
jgi:anti-anti-sigma factor